jgi:putative ABC transport system permease protein
MAPTDFPRRLYSALLVCYPAAFRNEYGPEMLELYNYRASRENAALLWMELLADIAYTAPKEHLDVFLQDLRYTFRTFAKTPVFALTALLTLALGTGVNTAIFSVVNAVILRPLPFPQPERLVRIWEMNQKLNIQFFSTSVLNYLSFKEQAKSFEAIGSYGGANVNITGAGEPERLAGGTLTSSMFDVVKIRPIAGRGFRPEEETPGRGRVAILSERLWKRRFQGDAHVVGRSIELNGTAFEVVGILPDSFRLPSAAEIWIPMIIDPAHENRGNHVISTVARLRPGATFAQAVSDLKTIAAGLGRTFPESNEGWNVRVATFYDWIVPSEIRTALTILLGAVGLVLLIACANVANLMLARAAGRSREIAMRITLGAGRTRLVRQLLTENLALGIIGGLSGTLLAFWAVAGLKRILPPSVPRVSEIGVDGMVLSFALFISIFSGVLFGLVPIWHATRRDLAELLKEGGRTSTSSRPVLRNTLVILEVALGTVLVIGASLMVRSFINLHHVQLGFTPDRLLTAQISLPRRKYPPPAAAAFYQDLLDRLKSVAGVNGAAISSGIPFGAGDYTGMQASAANDGRRSSAEATQADWRMVSADYFKVMGIPLLHGRFANSQDAAGQPVVIISAGLARRLWGNQNAAGKEMEIGNGRNRSLVIGVVGDARNNDPAEEPAPAMYFPAPPALWSTMTVVIKTSGDELKAAELLRQKIKELDANQPIFNVRSMEQWVTASAAQPRAYAFLLSIFAGLALLLACIGIYGVLSYSVAQRTSEIGLRMALGARQWNVLQLVIGQGMLMVAGGLLLGLGGALALARLIRSMLYGVSPHDPETFVAVCVSLLLIALAACFLPAMRATRVDPVVALRSE